MEALTISRVGDTSDKLGECPLWDDVGRCLYWADCREGVIHRLDVESGERIDFTVPAPLGSFALSGDNRALLALKDGFAVYDFASQRLGHLATLGIGHPSVRINDGIADPAGGFICGTMHVVRAEGEAPLGGLYRVDGAGRIEQLDTGIGVVNGPCFSPDGATFYLADSSARKIWRYPRDGAGRLGKRELFIDFADLGSAPDGATVDREGFLWSALVHRGAIARFSPDGRLDRMVEVPVRHPTSLAFGGEELDILYVTSISDSGRLSDPDPRAGGLFAIEGLGVIGLAEHRVRLRP